MRAINIRQGSQQDRSASSDNDKSLSELSADYLALIGADQSNKPPKDPLKGFSWTGVVNMAHFAITGCRENPLSDDVAEALVEI